MADRRPLAYYYRAATQRDVDLRPPPIVTVDTFSNPPQSGDQPLPAAGLRVLVVEDNVSDRWYFSELLRARGYTVISCESGETAWEAFQDDPQPLILMDLMLPGIDGLELCRRIRAREAPQPVIIAITGGEETAAASQILEAGGDDFIRKPVDPTLLNVRLMIAERRIHEQGERQETADALESTTRELAKLFHNLADVFFSVDLRTGRLIQVSPASSHVFGQSPDYLLQHPEAWRRYLLPREGSGDPWQALREDPSSGPWVREYPIQREGGSTRWIRATVEVERDDAGHPIRADGVARDTTEERTARVELARRNEELDALHRLAEVSLATSSSLDDAYGQILKQVSEALGMPIVAIEHVDRERDRLVVTAARGLPGSEGTCEAPVHGSLSGEALRSRRPVIAFGTGDTRGRVSSCLDALALEFFAAFPLLGGREALGTLIIASTDPVKWNARRTALAANLATSVAAYAERLEAEEALRVNEARFRTLAGQLSQANKELESFAYSVSHDLRAPLRTMQGFAHALLQNFGDGLEPEARDYARRIIASGRQSEELISGLLEYSRLSFEQMELKPVDLDRAVDAARSQVEAYLIEAGADLTVEEGMPTVLGSHTMMVQVMANLLSNAVKFVPDGRTPKVSITTEERGDKVRVWVVDNGIGVPEGQEERIFRVFERLSEGSAHPGTGIGLAVVRRGMQRIGGDCGVEPRQPHGSAFWIEAPTEGRARWRPWARRGT